MDFPVDSDRLSAQFYRLFSLQYRAVFWVIAGAIGAFGLLLPRVVSGQHITSVELTGLDNDALSSTIAANLSDVLTAFNKAFESDQSLELNDQVSSSGKEAIESIWKNHHFYCQETSLKVRVIHTENGFEVRQIPIILEFDSVMQKRKNEEGVFHISRSGAIEDFRFGLAEHQYEKLLGKRDDVTDVRRRQTIINFVENIRTAYNRKDLPFLEDVYSDDALIIIGRVVQPERGTDGDAMIPTTKIEYIRRKKSEYIEELSRIFSTKDLIDVQFDDITVVQHPVHSKIYGVTLLQHWTTNSYSDSGYLFLMIDFRDETMPIIHVRTWQPEREVSQDDVFRLSDFWING